MERLGAWSLSFVSGFVVAVTMGDDFQLGHDSTMGNQIDIVFGVACASMVVSLLFIISNIACAAKMIGGYVELGLTAASSAMWIVAIMYAVNPNDYLSISIISGNGSLIAGYFNEGQELIVNANLFLSSWISFLSSIYIVISIIVEKFKIEDKSFTQWLMVLISGAALVANNMNTLDAACETDGNKACIRTKFAIAVGSVGIFMSLIGTLMAFLNKGGGFLQIFFDLITTVMYLAGTAFITTASGPARVMGNTYFALWGGFGVSAKLLHTHVTEKFFKEKADADDVNFRDDNVML